MKPALALNDAVEKAGIQVHVFARNMGMTWERIAELREGRFPNNHPYIPRMAKFIGMDDAQFKLFYCGGPPLSERMVKGLHSRLARMERNGHSQINRGKGVMLHPTESTAAKARQGKVLATVKVRRATARVAKAEPVRRRNSLKRQHHTLRQAVRGMLDATNIAIMRGVEEVELPTAALHVVLLDYAERYGIKGNVLLDPSYAKAFD